jgi:hypothetical protein
MWVIAFSALAADPAGLDAVLERAAKYAERAPAQMSAVTCTETLLQRKLGENGKTLTEHRAIFDYLILMDAIPGGLSVDESRVAKKDDRKREKAPLLVTNGFAALTVLLHPAYQGSYEYRRLPDEDGRQRIEFVHAAGEKSPTALLLKGREAPIEWRGIAWIDAASGAATRIQARLKTPMEEIGLIKLEADVIYAPVQFAKTGETYWLPQWATIDAATLRQAWRNVHHFTGYQRFNVETDSRVGKR